MKKFFALVLAVMMVMSLALPAAADDTTTYTLTINNTVGAHTYEAYQIFKGTLSADGTTLSNVEWGDSIADGQGDALLDAILNDDKVLTVTGGTTTLKAVFASAAAETDKVKQFDKMVELLGTVSNDSSALDRFAEIVGKAEYNANDEFVKHTYLDDPVATDDYKDNKYELVVPAGYYLIKDQEGTQGGENNVEGGFYTKYIVRVVKSDSINPKGSGVIIDKTINDTLVGDYGNVKDFDVNDDVFYKLVGTIPTNLRAYDEYWYQFTDNLSAGLTFERIEQIYIENHNGATVHTFYDLNDTATNNDTLPNYGTDTPDDSADDYSINVKTENNTIVVEFTDLLKLYPSLLSTDKVVVKYSCYLNRDALIAQANTNEAYLEYDNNPNGEGHGKTVPDVAHAFTFKVTIDKYDMADQTKKLEGVEFKLYYRTVDANEEIVKMYAQVVTEEMIAAKTEINGKAVDADDLGLVYGWTSTEAEASVLDTDANGAFSVKGLDEGTYFLEETKTVDGYNLLDTPVQIDIIPTYTETATNASVTVEYKVDSIPQGTNGTVGVRNSKGSTLPSTGGMGTTLFYVLGSVLVLGALVMLITKKRMAAEN